MKALNDISIPDLKFNCRKGHVLTAADKNKLKAVIPRLIKNGLLEKSK